MLTVYGSFEQFCYQVTEFIGLLILSNRFQLHTGKETLQYVPYNISYGVLMSVC